MTTIQSDIAIFSTADGSLVLLAPKATALRTGQGSSPLPVGYSHDTWRWDATKRQMIEQMALVDAQLVALVKAEAARLKMNAISPGSAKPQEYRLKGEEAKASANVLVTVLNALLPAAAMTQYPTAATEAQITGDPLATVLSRYRTGSTASDPEVRRIAAIEWQGKVKIRAAATGPLKRAAYLAIDWDWKPKV